jgi:hypothetical protein
MPIAVLRSAAAPVGSMGLDAPLWWVIGSA